jgi:MprA protease rhombosortase-interaction domain-containing protein
MKTLIALTAGFVVASSLVSNAQTVTWNLGGGMGYAASNGTTLSFTQSGVKVTASAWGYTKGSGNTAFENAKLGQWSPGLGVVNRDESNSSPWHQVDNNKQNDYILFVFDKLVDITSIRVTPSPSGYDTDASYWVGNISSSNLADRTYANLGALGFSGEQISYGSTPSSGASANVAINAPSSGVNAILIGAQRIGSAHFDSKTDAFKIGKITATVVPEPSAALLTAVGALGFCLRRRR